MKISIKNFKSIKSLQSLEIKPLTVLSGTNSAGKSSFIQLLLILKQTIELDSSKKLILLKGDYYSVENFEDIIYNHDLNRKLNISFEFSKSEIEKVENLKNIAIFKAFGNYICTIDIKYDLDESKNIFITLFSVMFKFEDAPDRFIIINSNLDKTFSIKTNNSIFAKEIYGRNYTVSNVSYSSIYPTYYQYNGEDVEIELGDYKPKVNNSFKELLELGDIKIF